MSYPNIIQQVNSKLPLSGGTLTGIITRNGYLARSGSEDNILALISGTDTKHGAGLWLAGNSYSGSVPAGAFRLQCYNPTTQVYTSLTGTNTGSLTWNGGEVITSKGGTFNGNLNFSTSAGVIRDVGGVDTENKPLYQLSFGFETHEKLGGYILLRRGDSTAYNQAGMVALCASLPDQTRNYLFLYPNGTATIDGNRIICEKYYSNGRNGWAYYSNGIAYIWGYSFFPANVYQLSITFPYPLIDASYNVYGSAYTSVADVIAMGADLTTTGFLFCCRRSYDLKYDFDIGASYYVIGRWK